MTMSFCHFDYHQLRLLKWKFNKFHNTRIREKIYCIQNWHMISLYTKRNKNFPKNKCTPIRGVEPRSPRWKRDVIAVTLYRILICGIFGNIYTTCLKRHFRLFYGRFWVRQIMMNTKLSEMKQSKRTTVYSLCMTLFFVIWFGLWDFVETQV